MARRNTYDACCVLFPREPLRLFPTSSCSLLGNLRHLASALPPRRPSVCAALSLPSSVGNSAGPTVAITGGFWSFDFLGKAKPLELRERSVKLSAND